MTIFDEVLCVLAFLAGVLVVTVPPALLAAYVVWKRLTRPDG